MTARALAALVAALAVAGCGDDYPGKPQEVAKRYMQTNAGTKCRYKLERPAFGGVTGRPLGVTFRSSRNATARLRVTRGAHTVKTYARRLRANRTRRIRLSARGLARGDYRFRLVVRSGRSVTRSTLLSVRL